MTNRYLYITLLAVLGFSIESQGEDHLSQSCPRLVVNIAIDQFRGDYLEAFAPLYGNDGFRRLLAEGLVYPNASYPFSPIDRASALAAISTGTTPYYNNIVGERWLNRETLRPVWCVDDSKFAGINTSDASSADNIGTSTMGDELKMATGGRAVVYGIAPFRDAAILSVGHAANGAVWIDDVRGQWCTTTYYTNAAPTWLRAYNGLNAPLKRIENLIWEPVDEWVGNFSYFMQTGIQKPFRHEEHQANPLHHDKMLKVRSFQQLRNHLLMYVPHGIFHQ